MRIHRTASTRTRLILASCLVAMGLALLVPLSSAAAAAPAGARPALTPGASICLNAHVQNIGWQGWRCVGDPNFAFAGTTGQSLRMEALQVRTMGVGGVCLNAHVQNIGWQGWRCAGDGSVVTVGTTGQSLRMEAVALQVGFGGICAVAHIQNLGWQNVRCASGHGVLIVGTTGQSLRLEALAVQV